MIHTGMTEPVGQQGAPGGDPRESWHSPMSMSPTPAHQYAAVPGLLPFWLKAQNRKWMEGGRPETGALPEHALCEHKYGIGTGYYGKWTDGKCVKTPTKWQGPHSTMDLDGRSDLRTPGTAKVVTMLAADKRRRRNKALLTGAGAALAGVFLLRGILK